MIKYSVTNIPLKILMKIFFSLSFLLFIYPSYANQMPPLLHTYPTLTKTLGHVTLTPSPSTIKKIKLMQSAFPFYIKQEDASIPLNATQLRRLEFIMGEAFLHKAKGIITVAYPDDVFAKHTMTNARSLGLECFFLCKHDTEVNEQNAHHIQNLINAGISVQNFKSRGTLEITLHKLNKQFKKDHGIELYFLYQDGECEAGALGFLNAVFELKDQIQNNEILAPETIFFISDSAADMVGLIIGLQACNINSHVVVINTNTAIIDGMKERVKILFDCTQQYLFEREELFPRFPFPEEKVSIISCATTPDITQTIINHYLFKNIDQQTLLVWNTTSFELKDFPW